MKTTAYLHRVSLIDSFVVEHLFPRLYVSIGLQQLLRLLVNISVLDVDERRGPLEVLQVDVLDDPGVDDNMVSDVVDRQTAVNDLPLGDGHPVVVHLLVGELVIHVQGLARQQI